MRVTSIQFWFSVATAGLLVLAGCSRFEENRKRCATESISLDQAQQIQARIAQFQPSEKRSWETRTLRTIKVYFHVINKGPDREHHGNLDRAQIDKQMTVLNDLFKGTQFQFELSNVDWTTNPLWFEMMEGSAQETEAMQALGVKPRDVLNIYTANIGPYGWAVYPWYVTTNPYRDGVVIRYSTLPGGEATSFNLGKTLVHEVGHWLGLLHPFDGGCRGYGDYVPDTPPEKVPGRDCSKRDTCPDEAGWDPVDNFMDESFDACISSFTEDQLKRMQAVFAAYRQ